MEDSSLRWTPARVANQTYVINICYTGTYLMGARESRRDGAEDPSSGVDYYQLLQVKEDASADEIKVKLSILQ